MQCRLQMFPLSVSDLWCFGDIWPELDRKMWWVGGPCPVFVQTYGWGLILCLYIVTSWSVLILGQYILWRGEVSCPGSVYCDGVVCRVLGLYTVTGWNIIPYVCILWRSGVICTVSAALHSSVAAQTSNVLIWSQVFKATSNPS